MQKVYIDCGAWTGDSVSKFMNHYNDYNIYNGALKVVNL